MERRYDTITYPPELLPRASADDDVEIVVCVGPPVCYGKDEPCAKCRIIDPKTEPPHD